MTATTSKKLVDRPKTTRLLIQKHAQERGAVRSNKVAERVRAVMLVIEQEMDANCGVYPHNKGALSSAEFARRADIHETTLYSPKQRELGDKVRKWLASIKEPKATRQGSLRRDLATRIADWRKIYDGLAQAHRDTELELQETQHQLSEARERLAELEHENTRLQQLVVDTVSMKVVPIRPKKN